MRKKLEDDKKTAKFKIYENHLDTLPPPPAGEKGGSPRWRECIKEIIVVSCLDVAGGRWGEGGAAEHPEEEAGRGDEEDPGHHRPDAPQADLCGKNCLVPQGSVFGSRFIESGSGQKSDLDPSCFLINIAWN